MRHIVRLSIALAALAFTGCAVQANEPADEEFSASEAQALHASTLYAALVGNYASSDTPYPTFELAKDRTFTLDTGIRCITTPCPSGDAGKWTLYTYKGRYYLNLAGAEASRWYYVQSFSKGVLVGMTDKGTWTKQVEAPTSGCAAILCAPDSICVDDGSGAKCITKCATVRCTSDTYCDASSGTAQCVAYACPKESYVNCMPPVTADRARLCSGDLHEWIKTNCSTEFVY